MVRSDEVVVRLGASGFRTEISTQQHVLIADEPTRLGGTDEGPTPYALLTAALGSCTAMTLRMFADRRGWPLEGVTVRLRHGREHTKDCENCESLKVGVDQIERLIELSGPLSDEQRASLHRVADRCPVAQTLSRGVRIAAAEVTRHRGGGAAKP